MLRPAFFQILCFLLLASTPTFAQSLYDVVVSLSDRQRVVTQRSQVRAYQYNQYHNSNSAIPMDNPIDWHSVGTNPTQANVDGLSIGDKIAVLNQAVQEFERLKFNFLNCGNVEFSTGANIANLPSYGESDFDPLPRTTPENYHAVLMALAQRVGSLRTLPWVAAFKEIRQTRRTNVQESLARDENNEYYVVTPENLPAGFDWKPVSLGPDGFVSITTNDNIYSISQAHTEVRANGDYRERTEEDLVLRSAYREMFLTYYESAQLITTAPGAEGTQIDGVATILRRSKWHELSLTGAHAHFDTDHAGHVVIGSGNTQSIPLIASPPAPAFNGSWKITSEEDGGKTENFITDGYEYLEAFYSGNDSNFSSAYEFSWKVGCTYTAVFRPVFSRGIDTSGVRAKLESAASVLAETYADGKFLLNPRPGLLIGIKLGAGLNGMGNAYISCGNPRGPRGGTHGLERFDSSYNLQFAGNAADYHIVYDIDRSTRTQTLPGLGWPRPYIFGATHDHWTLQEAWDTPRLKQVVGRDLVVNVTYNEKHYGGYTLNIYRRPTNSPELVPGQLFATSGLTLIRTWEFSSDNGAVAHPNAVEHLKATGINGEQYIIQAEHVLTDLEWDHWQYGWWNSNWWHGGLLPEEQGNPYWRVMLGSWGWTLKALDGTVEKYRKEIEISNLGDDWLWPLVDFTSKNYVDGELVSTLSSMWTESFSNRTPLEWEITIDGKTISGTADLGDPFELDPAFGYGKWPTSMSIEYDGIQPDANYVWDSKGLLTSMQQGAWKTDYSIESGALKAESKFNNTRYATTWTEWSNNDRTIKTYSAPDGSVSSKTANTVDWAELTLGNSSGTGLPGLPHSLSRKDGSGLQWAWNVGNDHSGSLTVTADTQTTTTAWNNRGYPISSQTSLVVNGTATVASHEVPAGQFTTWGAPTQWKDLQTNLSTQIAYQGGLNRPSSITSPLGLTTGFSNYDIFDRPGQVASNGITASNIYTAFSTNTTYAGAGVMSGSQSSFSTNPEGTDVSTSLTWGGVAKSSNIQRGASTTNITGSHSLLGSSAATLRNDDNSLSASNSTTLAFGGVTGDALSISNGLFVTKSAVADLPGRFATTHTDAWGRVHKIVTPSKSGGNTETRYDYSNPGNPLKRVITTEPSGRVLITESQNNGTITRSGIDVDEDGTLGGNADRYTESTTTVENSKVITILRVSDEPGPGVQSGLREVLRTEWTPSNGVTVTKINGNEETITTTPDYTAKTVKTESSKGWERNTAINNLGLPSSNTLDGTGIPTTGLTPIWRADGSLESVSLAIGGETHTANFNPDSTLSSLTAPGRGNLLGEHSISGGVEILEIDGVKYEKSLDGTYRAISGPNVIDRSNTLTTSSGGFKDATVPAIGAPTETFMSAAGAPTMKLYADASGEVYGYDGELLTSISLARGGALALDYSNDGAKDHIGTAWPAMTSGPFTIPSITEAYGYDRAGRRNFIGDNSGGRAFVFHNGRIANTIYNSGLLQGYEIIPSRDTAGRHTGTMIKRDGNAIHTTEKALYGVSNQILDLASGGITATPQRDAAGNITGYIWSDGTNNVSQSWQRGPGGRIEAATNNVPGAPQFLYLIDPNDPEESFDAFGRRLKAQTAGGVWSYEYGIAGQLIKATHTSLGTFNYHFDAIGRRTVSDDPNNIHPNRNDILNRAVAWEHDQSKTLTIKAHPDARVWFNGVEIPNFTGQHQATVGTPGSNGQWVPWETLAVLEGAGEGAGDPPVNPHASPDAKAEKKGAVWVPPTEETFTFDAAGNRESSAQWHYGWDAKNQLTRIRTKNHIAEGSIPAAPQAYDIHFTYDSEGRRVKKHVIEYQNGTVFSEKIVTFVWEGWDLLYERHQLPSGLTTLERKYLWGPDIAGGQAGGAGGLLLIRETTGNTTTEIIPLYDGSGNIIALTDINKNLLAEYVHGPFGERVHATGPLAQSNPWRWATKYHDAETGFYYFGKRFMDPITGQFLSRDPLGENESINLYQYCHNDPINKVDVLGLRSKWVTNPNNPVTEMPDGSKVINLVWLVDKWFGDDYLDYSKRNTRAFGSNYWDHHLWKKRADGSWGASARNQMWVDTATILEEKHHFSTHAKIGTVAMGGYSALLAAPVAGAYGTGSLITAGGATVKSSALQATNWILVRPGAQILAADIAYTTGEIAMGIDGPGGLVTPADSLRAVPKAARYADELFNEMRRLELAWPTTMRQLSNSGVPLNMASDSSRIAYELMPIHTTGNYLSRYLKADPGLPNGWHVHHTIPQKYQSLFEDLGVDIGGLQFLRGVDPAIHSRITTEWGRFDKRFGGQPTAADVSRFVQEIDKRFGDHLRIPGL